jgi:hypothetical protein
MSVTAIYVFSPTAFTVDVQSTIEHLARNASGGYSVVAEGFAPGTPFNLEPGAYRLSAGARITAAPGFAAAAMPATGGTACSTGHIIALSDTKTRWPDPPATAASAALNISLATLEPFLTDAGEETMLDAAPSANG